jgi:RNA polymerase sigma factor (TIGR02999 family)
MASFRNGDRQAANQLVEMFYPQLRRLAGSKMRGERTGHSWQPTLLVNELYLQLVRIKALPAETEGGNEKAAFLSLAGLLMKRLLIHHTRPLSQRVTRLEMDEEMAMTTNTRVVDEMEEALGRLEAIRPRLRTIVELKVFEGLTGEEIAERLECSYSTVTRDWDFARHWLRRELALPLDR